MPRVSIVIPCYNREKLLPETLDSLCAQTYSDWEAVIVDDGSRDSAREVAAAYAQIDARFRPVSRQGERRGANVCRNQGLGLAKGEFVIFLDSDDLLAPACLARRVADMEAARDCGFGVYLTELFAERVGDRKVLWNAFASENDLYRFLSLDSVWDITGPIWRKQSLVELGGIDEDLLSFQDWAISVRALIAQIRYFKMPVRDHFYRHASEPVSAISTVSGTEPKHLLSHERLFEKTRGLLLASMQFDRQARCRIAGLFWWLAKRWLSISSLSGADRVWRRAHELDLCNARQCFEGRMIFRLYAFRGGGRIARMIQAFWPSQFYQLYSKTWQNAPVSCEYCFEEHTLSAH